MMPLNEDLAGNDETITENTGGNNSVLIDDTPVEQSSFNSLKNVESYKIAEN